MSVSSTILLLILKEKKVGEESADRDKALDDIRFVRANQNGEESVMSNQQMANYNEAFAFSGAVQRNDHLEVVVKDRD